MSAEGFDTPTLFESAGKPVAVGSVGHRVVIACQAPGGGSLLKGDVAYQMRLWDLETRRPLGPWIADDPGFEKVAVGEFAGKPVIACGGNGGVVRVRDATTGHSLGSVNIEEPWVRALAVRELNGNLVLVASCYAFQAWDVQSREPLTPRFGNWDGYPCAVAAGYLNGDPVVVVVDSKEIFIWSLIKRSLIRKIPSVAGEIMALALTDVGDKPVLMLINEEEGEPYRGNWGMNTQYSVVRFWDLSTTPAVGKKLAIRALGANGVAAGRLSGQHVVVSTYSQYAGSYEGEVRVWRPAM